MAAPIHIDATAGLTWFEDERGFIVTIDGKDTRHITRDGSSFIAWLGYQDRHWCFQRALNACAEHARFHRAEHERQVAAYEASQKRLASLTQHQPCPIRPHTTVCHNGTVTYGVTIDGESYECSERELAMLRAGHSPTALELSPWEASDDYAGTAWDRDASAGDTSYQLREEQF